MIFAGEANFICRFPQTKPCKFNSVKTTPYSSDNEILQIKMNNSLDENMLKLAETRKATVNVRIDSTLDFGSKGEF